MELLATAGLLLGLQAQEPPQDMPPAREELEATLLALKGTVDVRRPEDKDWIPAERDMSLKKGSEICTSVASTATLLFTGNVKVEVRALTQARIEDLAKLGRAVNAEVKLKFGTIEVDVQKGDLRADMKVTTPNSTTSVSGSHGIVRAPACAAGDTWITFHAVTGDWEHHVWRHDLTFFVRGAALLNLLGDLYGDILRADAMREYHHIFGRNDEEASLLQGAYPGAGVLPFFEYGSSLSNPFWNYFNKGEGLLPPPPPPPPLAKP